MKKKGLLSGLLVVGLLATASPAAAAPMEPYIHGTPVTIHVDGEYLPTDVDPVIDNGRTLVPLRAAGEAVGAEVSWDQPTQTATVSKDGLTVSFRLGSITYFVNGESRLTDVPPQMKNNRTMLPIRVLAEAIGAEVTWNQDLLDVAITTNGQIITIPHAGLVDSAALDAEYLLRKYYVAPDPSDPFVGTWKRTVQTGNQPPATYYEFISKLSNGQYSYYRLNISQDYSVCTVPIVILFRETGETVQNGNVFRRSDNDIPTYFRGPAMGFTSEGYSDYIIGQDDTLICTSTTSTLGGQHETFYLYDISHRVVDQ